ncbi:rhomboid family intramembrane serine protease [Flavicella sediminum]|uniref:rhomboid family intramembrane serine protease n=1 Tax=Flavicella sediminum TaxID=2585141 RepID=UPI00111E0E87|nr:rhomboid family intramembrane serine protease [Flavicella sediminum]
MNSTVNNLLYKYKNGSIVEKLIYLNVVAFLLMYVVNSVAFLFNYQGANFVYEWFSMPADVDYLITRPWTIITYGFLHGDFLHILFNLIWLYYIGNLFIDYFTQKQLLSFYIYGTVFGGLIYLLSYNFFPALQNTNATLVGASSAVSAIFIGIATYIPNYEFRLRFIGFVKLWVLAAIFVAIDVIQLPSGNTGGHLAHLGGALFGYLYVRQFKKSSVKISNPFANLFKRKSTLKTVYKSKRKTSTTASDKNSQQQIDAILDKISKSGYDSLNQKEKDLLFKQSKK